MAKKREPPKPIRWGVYKLAAKAARLDEVETQHETPPSREASRNSRQRLDRATGAGKGATAGMSCRPNRRRTYNDQAIGRATRG
jgi:hypothetical protein